ncbi:uncharacterized protein LOC115628551 [Scaptodrosophila lebanonensis]|uniref:Uncharacterized protein LOC115628551 n=1 Tax=Drosophila lebanonensis TaxID=7225 RepID=A0A6J2TZF1_DROLE|nr:uncharacterized protein LOC115628551 [Scaptodrosophila lebanonensis]
MDQMLNEFCWLSILQHLELRDHLALAQVSETLHSIVKYHWRSLSRVKILDDTVQRLTNHPRGMHEFLECASASLQELELKNCSFRLLRKWEFYSFPKLHTLDYQTMYNEDCADEETLLLTQLFPNLRKLTLSNSTSGLHLWCWSKLQELHLIRCDFLNSDLFEEIFSKLPLRKLTLLYYGDDVCLDEGIFAASLCKTLEELVVDDHHLVEDCLRNLLRLPKIRRLTFYTRDYCEYLLKKISKQQPLKVNALLFNDSFWKNGQVAENVLRMLNLRRFALYDDDIGGNQLHSICEKMPNLQELYLMKMRQLPSTKKLWDAIAASDALKVLDLSNTKLDEEFLESSVACLEPTLSKRSAPLQLNCHNCDISQERILTMLKHPKLQVTFDPVKTNIWSARFVDIEFTSTVADLKGSPNP